LRKQNARGWSKMSWLWTRFSRMALAKSLGCRKGRVFLASWGTGHLSRISVLSRCVVVVTIAIFLQYSATGMIQTRETFVRQNILSWTASWFLGLEI
jgi:hypothetical protein